MTKDYRATVGTISHGALLDADLIEAFAWELRRFRANVGEGTLTAQEAKLIDDCDLWLESDDPSDDAETAQTLLDDLREALESRAPHYCYFGSLEGDGSDFGFWPCMEQIEELPRVEDSDGARELGEDCISVNDHGNVTVYGVDGSVLLEVV